MTTSTAGLLANMHQNLVAQPSTAESTSDSIQAIHWGSHSNPAGNQPLQLPHALPSATSGSSPTTSGMSAANTWNSGYGNGSITQSPQRPLFTVTVEHREL